MQINLQVNGLTVIRCTDCYERELWHARKHTKQGFDAEALYRQALRP